MPRVLVSNSEKNLNVNFYSYQGLIFLWHFPIFHNLLQVQKLIKSFISTVLKVSLGKSGATLKVDHGNPKLLSKNRPWGYKKISW